MVAQIYCCEQRDARTTLQTDLRFRRRKSNCIGVVQSDVEIYSPMFSIGLPLAHISMGTLPDSFFLCNQTHSRES